MQIVVTGLIGSSWHSTIIDNWKSSPSIQPPGNISNKYEKIRKENKNKIKNKKKTEKKTGKKERKQKSQQTGN